MNFNQFQEWLGDIQALSHPFTLKEISVEMDEENFINLLTEVKGEAMNVFPTSEEEMLDASMPQVLLYNNIRVTVKIKE